MKESAVFRATFRRDILIQGSLLNPRFHSGIVKHNYYSKSCFHIQGKNGFQEHLFPCPSVAIEGQALFIPLECVHEDDIVQNTPAVVTYNFGHGMLNNV